MIGRVMVIGLVLAWTPAVAWAQEDEAKESGGELVVEVSEALVVTGKPTKPSVWMGGEAGKPGFGRLYKPTRRVASRIDEVLMGHTRSGSAR